jgi:hypothetical protein
MPYTVLMLLASPAEMAAFDMETTMRLKLLPLLATTVIMACATMQPAAAGTLNRDGCGMYSPEGRPVRGVPRAYRYDPRSWCYQPRGYYGYYNSGYWVPRAEMRYRYRYQYQGPLYTYYPAWGY